MNSWNLREDLYLAFHRWYLFAAAFLAGSLLGWGAALLFPSPYLAEAGLNVGYNGEVASYMPVPQDIAARNADDYKNWQLGELEAFIYSNGLLEDTLTHLRAQDPYWEGVSVEALRPSLRTYWRNAGAWQLAVRANHPALAEALAQTWRQVILDRAGNSAAHALRVLELGYRLRDASAAELEAAQRSDRLAQAQRALQGWLEGQGAAAMQQPVSPQERWRLQALAALALSPAGAPPAGLPAETAPAAEYLPWVQQAIARLDVAREIAANQVDGLAVLRQSLAAEWADESRAAHNLTAYLSVETFPGGDKPAQPVRYTAQAALAGGALGVLLLALFWLASPLGRRRA
ncbi:MAG: hypothetical protein L0Z70_00710 [Chloroflexi bacterium]|nr:hypothetical protein [Chloroflexota bacterium]